MEFRLRSNHSERNHSNRNITVFQASTREEAITKATDYCIRNGWDAVYAGLVLEQITAVKRVSGWQGKAKQALITARKAAK